MKVEELVRKCQKHFNYREIVDEMQELIDYGSIIEFVVIETAKYMLDWGIREIENAEV